jgi:hypothetical protein
MLVNSIGIVKTADRSSERTRFKALILKEYLIVNYVLYIVCIDKYLILKGFIELLNPNN